MCLAAIMAVSKNIKAQEVTITLMPGWTWFSCPLMDTLDFDTALGSFSPMAGDIIKSQTGTARYLSSNRWRGTVSQFYPGRGYKYKSNRTEPVTVTFQVLQSAAPQVMVTAVEPTDITSTSAICRGNVASIDGNYVPVLKGICWSTNPEPNFNDNYIEAEEGIGSFAIPMTGLDINTTYHVRAYAVTANGTVYGNDASFTTMDVPSGAINSLFSVSESQQVYFSQGNLQYQASTDTWRFAEYQFEFIGNANNNISSTNSDWIDLFGWGTSGYYHGANCYQPWSTSLNNSHYYAYGNSAYNLYNQTGQADWGYNPISNGDNLVNYWRTLTQSEWDYVFNTRTTASGIRFAKAQVTYVNGVILLPDNWNNNIYNLNDTNDGDACYTSNIISVSQWTILENAGAVFLPAAGIRYGTSMLNAGNIGYYWSATRSDNSYVHGVFFNDGCLNSYNEYSRYYGRSVRLVANFEN